MTLSQKIIILNYIVMATNPPKGDWHRNWAVKDRTQFYNPKTGLWYKRAPDWTIMDCKTSDNSKFKWVRKEK